MTREQLIEMGWTDVPLGEPIRAGDCLKVRDALLLAMPDDIGVGANPACGPWLRPLAAPVKQAMDWEDVQKLVLAALRDYRCQHSRDVDGDALGLVDVLSADDGTIGSGGAELELLAEHVSMCLEGGGDWPEAPPKREPEPEPLRCLWDGCDGELQQAEGRPGEWACTDCRRGFRFCDRADLRALVENVRGEKAKPAQDPLRCYHPACELEPRVIHAAGVCYVSCTEHPLIVARAEQEESAAAAYRVLAAMTRGGVADADAIPPDPEPEPLRCIDPECDWGEADDDTDGLHASWNPPHRGWYVGCPVCLCRSPFYDKPSLAENWWRKMAALTRGE